MLLSEKLLQMNNELEVQKTIEEEKVRAKEQEDREAEENIARIKREAELNIIEENINQLESLKAKLEIILNSIKFNPAVNDGYVMQNYPQKVFNDKSESVEYLNKLVKDNTEVLDPLGIDTMEKLIESPLAKDSKEVLDYYASSKARDELLDADSTLYDKLIELGVINEDDKDIKSTNGFALYDKISKKLEDKIGDVTENLLLEKIKTNEGHEAREELVQRISKEIFASLSNLRFSTNKNNDGFEEITLSNNIGKMLIKDNHAKFTGWINDEISPDITIALAVKYGEELTNESLKRAYEDKVDVAYKNLDRETGNEDSFLKGDLDRCNGERWNEAKESYNQYVNKVNELKDILSAKSEELKGIGVNFNPERPSGFGCNYSEIYSISEYQSDNDKIKYLFDFNGGVYPEEFYYDSLKTVIDEKSVLLDLFIHEVSRIESANDVDNFIYGPNIVGKQSILSEIYGKFLTVNRSKIKRYTDNNLKKLSKFSSHEDAENYFDKVSRERNSKKHLISNLISNAISAKKLKIELENELKAEGWHRDISYIENGIKNIEVNREDAFNALYEITRLEYELPEGRLIMEGGQITDSSVAKLIEEQNLILIEKDTDLKIIEGKIQKKEDDKPRIFGIKTWEDELKSLKEARTKLKNEISHIRSIEIPALYDKKTFYLKTRDYSDVQKTVRSQKRIEGTKEEILSEIKESLTEISLMKIPENIIKLNKEYTELQEKIYK